MNVPAPSIRDCICLILAAGKGSRMGTPKALMISNQRPWWSLQLAQLDAAQLASIWIVSPTVRDAMEPRFPQTDTNTSQPAHQLITALNPNPAPLPMFASLLLGLESLALHPPAAIFVLPVDVPIPSPATFHALLQHATSPVRIPVHNATRGHPVYLSWPWITEHILTTPRPDPATARLDQLIAPYAECVPSCDPRITMNINTPADLKKAQEPQSRGFTPASPPPPDKSSPSTPHPDAPQASAKPLSRS